MKTPEANKKDLVFAWMNKQIKATKTENISLFGNEIRRTYVGTDNTIQIHKGIKKISEITGISYFEEDWDGNKNCNTNYTIVYLMYKNYKFFELADKEEN